MLQLLILYLHHISISSNQHFDCIPCQKSKKNYKKEISELKKISPCSKGHSMVQVNNFQINSIFRQLSHNMTIDFFDGLFIFLQNFTYIVSNSKPKLNHLGPKLVPNSNILKNKQSLEISVNQWIINKTDMSFCGWHGKNMKQCTDY